MRNGLSRVDTVLLLGATSEIGIEILRQLNPRTSAILAGRPSELRERCVQELSTALDAEIRPLDWDASDTGQHEAVIDEAFAHGDVDVIVMAAGILGDQADQEEHPSSALEAMSVNYTGSVHTCLLVARHLRRQGHGTLLILSSVAAVRPRRSNFLYGSSKAGLDFVGRGLNEALRGSGARVVIVRPGFVRTRMTVGLPEAPFATDTTTVARTAVESLMRRPVVVYAPRVLQPVMGVLRHLPRSLFNRLDRG